MIGRAVCLELTESVIAAFMLASAGRAEVGFAVRGKSLLVGGARHGLITLVADAIIVVIDVVAGRGRFLSATDSANIAIFFVLMCARKVTDIAGAGFGVPLMLGADEPTDGTGVSRGIHLVLAGGIADCADTVKVGPAVLTVAILGGAVGDGAVGLIAIMPVMGVVGSPLCGPGMLMAGSVGGHRLSANVAVAVSVGGANMTVLARGDEAASATGVGDERVGLLKEHFSCR